VRTEVIIGIDSEVVLAWVLNEKIIRIGRIEKRISKIRE
jgi:hypothetical protein